MIILNASHAHRADFHLHNLSKIFRVDHTVRSRIFLVDLNMVKHSGIYRVKYAGDRMVAPLYSRVHITVTMIIVDGKS